MNGSGQPADPEIMTYSNMNKKMKNLPNIAFIAKGKFGHVSIGMV